MRVLSSKEEKGEGRELETEKKEMGEIGERRHIGLLDLNCFHIN